MWYLMYDNNSKSMVIVPIDQYVLASMALILVCESRTEALDHALKFQAGDHPAQKYSNVELELSSIVIKTC